MRNKFVSVILLEIIFPITFCLCIIDTNTNRFVCRIPYSLLGDPETGKKGGEAGRHLKSVQQLFFILLDTHCPPSPTFPALRGSPVESQAVFNPFFLACSLSLWIQNAWVLISLFLIKMKLNDYQLLVLSKEQFFVMKSLPGIQKYIEVTK